MSETPGESRPVVAELGRPETPQETADRKAESSRTYRESKTTKNLLWAFGVSLLIAVFIVLLMTRPDTPLMHDQSPFAPVDVAETATQAAGSLGAAPVVPVIDGWRANAARLEAATGDVTSWYVGLLTTDEKFIALRQGVDANQTWLAQQLESTRVTGERVVAGVTWQEYDRRTTDPTGIRAFALTTTIGSSTVVLFGTAGDAEFDELATAVVETLGKGS